MNTKIAFAPIIILLCLVSLSACNISNPIQATLPTAAATSSEAGITHTSTKVSIHTATPKSTLTSIPTKTQIPPQTQSPVPTLPTKPFIFDDQAPAWLVACLRSETESLVVAYNPDGSAVKDLLSFPIDENFCQVAATTREAGGLVAVVTAPVEENYYPSQLNLSVIQMPEGRVMQEIGLINAEKVKDTQGVLDPNILNAVGFNDGMSWSPDGSTLAFIAAIDGPTADVYLYDTQSGTVTRASQEPDQASGLIWSPDGRFILYQQVVGFGGGGSVSKAVWAVDIAARTARSLLDTGFAALTFDGWTKDGDLIAHPWGCMLAVPESRGNSAWLQRIDPQKRQVEALLPADQLPDGACVHAAYNPGDDWISLAVEYPADVKMVKGADGSLTKDITWGPQQFWAVPLDGTVHQKLFEAVSTLGIGLDISPSGRPGHWFARFEHEQFDLSLSGKGPVLDEGWFAPSVSPDHSWLAFYEVDTTVDGHHAGLRLVSQDGTTKRIITQEPVSGVLWQPDSQGLLFISNGKLFFLPIDQDTPIEMQSGVFPHLFARNITPSTWVMSPASQVPTVEPIPTRTAGPTPTALVIFSTPDPEKCERTGDAGQPKVDLGGENCVFWEDEIPNEIGFRIVLEYDNSGEIFIYDAPPNTEAFLLPSEASPRRLDESREHCIRRKDFSLTVYALVQGGTPEMVGGMAMNGECRLPELPTATAPAGKMDE